MFTFTSYHARLCDCKCTEYGTYTLVSTCGELTYMCRLRGCTSCGTWDERETGEERAERNRRSYLGVREGGVAGQRVTRRPNDRYLVTSALSLARSSFGRLEPLARALGGE